MVVWTNAHFETNDEWVSDKYIEKYKIWTQLDTLKSKLTKKVKDSSYTDQMLDQLHSVAPLGFFIDGFPQSFPSNAEIQRHNYLFISYLKLGNSSFSS